MIEKNCLMFNTIFRNKQQKVKLETFNLIKNHNASLDRHTGQALACLAGTMFSKSSQHRVVFLNELETISMAYELIFRRMKTMQWKDTTIKFVSFSSLVKTYIQTLWMKHPDKYEYVQDLIEQNKHIYTILLDDLIDWYYTRVRRNTLLYSLHRVKHFDKLRLKKLDKLVRILNKFTSKLTKAHLMDFMRKVNLVRPKDSLLYLLHGIFSYYRLLGIQQGFNNIKLITEVTSKKEMDKKDALNILKTLFDKKNKENIRLVPARTLFPVKPKVSRQDIVPTLVEALRNAFKKKLATSLNEIRYHGVPELITDLEEEKHTVEKVEHRLTVIKFKGVELLESTLTTMMLQRLGHPFRRLVRSLHDNLSINDHRLDGLKNLFFRRLFAGFNNIRERASQVQERKMINYREGLSNLDNLFKNIFNHGRHLAYLAFSRVKTIMIELQCLTVIDSTNANKIMFSVKDMLNTSGNLSGFYEEMGRSSQRYAM